MKTVTLTIKVQVPDDTDEKEVAKSIDRGLVHAGWTNWKIGPTVITRPRVDRAKR